MYLIAFLIYQRTYDIYQLMHGTHPTTRNSHLNTTDLYRYYVESGKCSFSPLNIYMYIGKVFICGILREFVGHKIVKPAEQLKHTYIVIF